MFETIEKNFQLPKMYRIRQLYKIPDPINVKKVIKSEINRILPNIQLKPGLKIAIGVGSRGIDQLSSVIKELVRELIEYKVKPFIIPAMGSHGWATAKGQLEILRTIGISEKDCKVPIKADMNVINLGKTNDGISLFLSRLAFDADGIIVVNRIKPHTNFIGKTESGLLKMMAIGLGNQKGAEHCHRLSLEKGLYEVISDVGKRLVKKSKFIFGVGIIENQNHKMCKIKFCTKHDIELSETKLLRQARKLMPALPVHDIDLLIVDQMGKNISGQGIDPNIVGRDCCIYGAIRKKPKILRIFVRDLTAASRGAALGIGMADFALSRLISKIDKNTTSINCITACCPEAGKLPLTFDTDRHAMAAAFYSIRPCKTNQFGIVHIKNTLDLNKVLVSEKFYNRIKSNPSIIIEKKIDYKFNRNGMLKYEL